MQETPSIETLLPPPPNSLAARGSWVYDGSSPLIFLKCMYFFALVSSLVLQKEVQHNK